MKTSDLLNNFKSSLSPKEDMRRFVFSIVREQNLDAGHVLLDRILFLKLIGLNPIQKDTLPSVIKDLIGEGVLEEKNGSLILTGKGKAIIYS